MFNLKKTFVGAALVAASALNVANAGVLDTFQYGPTEQVNLESSVVGTVSQGPLAVNPAGDVTYSLTVTSAGPAFDDEEINTKSSATIYDGAIKYSTDSDFSGFVELSYDFAPTSVLEGAATAFYIDVVSTDGFTAEVTFEDSSQGVSTGQLVVDPVTSAFPAERKWLTLNQFAGTADFTDIVSLTVKFLAGTYDADTGYYFEGDFTINEIGTVPEPTSLAILGLGLLGFAASRKKQA